MSAPSRPDTAQIRAMADEITTTGSGFPGLDTLDALTLILAADWIDAQPAADQRPDLEELRAEIADLREANARQAKSIQGFISEFGPSPLDRLLDREGG